MPLLKLEWERVVESVTYEEIVETWTLYLVLLGARIRLGGLTIRSIGEVEVKPWTR